MKQRQIIMDAKKNRKMHKVESGGYMPYLTEEEKEILGYKTEKLIVTGKGVVPVKRRLSHWNF